MKGLADFGFLVNRNNPECFRESCFKVSQACQFSVLNEMSTSYRVAILWVTHKQEREL